MRASLTSLMFNQSNSKASLKLTVLCSLGVILLFLQGLSNARSFIIDAARFDELDVEEAAVDGVD